MSTLATKVHEIVQRHIEAGEISGAITLIARDGVVEVNDVQGVADSDPNATLRSDTVFGVASMTKTLVAACALILASENALRLSDPVSKYIPEFAEPRLVRTLQPGEQYRIESFLSVPDDDIKEPNFDYAPAERELTVHDFLSFTAGLQTILIANPAMPPVGPTDTLETWVPKLATVPLEFQPGTRWHYSNATGYEVVARIIEVVSGMSLADFAAQRIFDPLGMTETGFGVQPWMSDRLAPLGPLAVTQIVRTEFNSGSAGLFSTAADYLKFAEMLRNDGRFGGVEVMPSAAVAAMRQNQIGELTFPGVRATAYGSPVPIPPDSGVTYGYGVAIVTGASEDVPLPVGSFGWDGVGTRRFWVIPSLRTTIVMLMPGLGDAADATHREIEALVAAQA
ncbi:serine hydrolase domain-containing protein [Mycolicibacterium sp. CBM1]